MCSQCTHARLSSSLACMIQTLERQKKLKPGEKEDDSGDASLALIAEDGTIELGTATSRKRRHAVAAPNTTTTDAVDGES